MRIHYCFDPEWVLNQETFPKHEKMVRDAGVTDLWLMGYFNGQFVRPLSKITEAKAILEKYGWPTGALNIPVGHPGVIDPDRPDLIFDIPNTWSYRIDSSGKPIKYCADIEPNMIRDNKDAIHQLANIGFKRVFLDDDCRMGNWGPEIRGCFCEKCIDTFNNTYKVRVSREELAKEIKTRRNRSLLRNWVQFNCAKINHLLNEIQHPKITLGLMVMHNGDARHGVNLEEILRANPNLMVRVGEAHFNDREFNSVQGRVEEIVGMQLHLNQIDHTKSYSETTIFPANALTPENWLLKARYALTLGIPNLFLMGGVWFIEPRYWEFLQKTQSDLQELGDLLEKGPPMWPIHLAMGSYLDAFYPPFLVSLNGIPANPVQASYLNDRLNAEILLVYGKFRFDEEWRPILPRYKYIICDSISFQRNLPFFQTLSNDIQQKIQKIPIPNSFFRWVKNRHEKDFIRSLRLYLKTQDQFPFLSSGSNILLIWLPKQAGVILCNLENVPSQALLYFRHTESEIFLSPQEVRFILLDKL